MKADLVQKYLPLSLVTSKGRVKHPRAGIKSNKKRKQEERDMSVRHRMSQPLSQKKNLPVKCTRSTTFFVMLPCQTTK